MKFYANITGGGAVFFGNFLRNGGRSNVFAGASIPYAKEFTDYICGESPRNYVTSGVARRLAMDAYDKIVDIYPKETVFGLGVTAKLHFKGERHGRSHKAFVCIYNGSSMREWDWEPLSKSRSAQEEELAIFIESIVDGIVDYKGLPKVSAKKSYDDLFMRNFFRDKNINRICVFSGTFNPWHEGHESIYQTSQKVLGEKPIVLISGNPVGKRAVDPLSLFERGEATGKPWIVGYASYFCDQYKEIYPWCKNIIFIVGHDTWERLKDTDSATCGAKYLVFPRHGEGVTKEEVERFGDCLLPESLLMDHADPKFHSISSTQIRNGKA